CLPASMLYATTASETDRRMSSAKSRSTLLILTSTLAVPVNTSASKRGGIVMTAATFWSLRSFWACSGVRCTRKNPSEVLISLAISVAALPSLWLTRATGWRPTAYVSASTIRAMPTAGMRVAAMRAGERSQRMTSWRAMCPTVRITSPSRSFHCQTHDARTRRDRPSCEHGEQHPHRLRRHGQSVERVLDGPHAPVGRREMREPEQLLAVEALAREGTAVQIERKGQSHNQRHDQQRLAELGTDQVAECDRARSQDRNRADHLDRRSHRHAVAPHDHGGRYQAGRQRHHPGRGQSAKEGGAGTRGRCAKESVLAALPCPGHDGATEGRAGDHGGQSDRAHAQVLHVVGVVREHVAQLRLDRYWTADVLGEDGSRGWYGATHILRHVPVDVVDGEEHERRVTIAHLGSEPVGNLNGGHETSRLQV